ncbi:MAG: hypothetical protein ABI868_09410 [Acidobacteriota bacterium]
MEVRFFPNSRRPGVGLPPRREPSRPLLSQHARHCPVLEAGSGLGFMVYPPLEPKESLYLEHEGDGRYKFVYYLKTQDGRPTPIFQITMTLSVGGVGMVKEEVTFVGAPMLSREAALGVARVFLVAEDMGTPPGAIALRGATNFQTPTGWDTVYTPIFNMIERPVAPMLVVRVETDWYAHETVFRYVLQAGEGITLEPSLPIGQVFFIPREPITMRPCTSDELTAIEESRLEFNRHKAAAVQKTSYGLSYSPHYLRQSRAQKSEGDESASQPPPRGSGEKTPRS